MAELRTFQAPTQLVFGPGAIARLGDLARELHLARMLIVTDPGVAKAGLATRALDILARAGVEGVVFADVEPNPSLATAERASALYLDSGCQALVAVGGGSPIDVAKAVGLRASNSEPLAAYIGIGKVTAPLPPLVTVPTTVGTGSEATAFAVLTDRAKHKKVVIGSPFLAPRWALLDPELVLTLPAALVASTGLDALTHAIESVISVFATPFSDGLALEAIHTIASNLRHAVRVAELESRAALLYASTMAGMAFSCARTGLVHGMAHPLGGYCDVPHGLANAILLPYVLAFNAPACKPGLARVAAAMGEPATAEAAIEAVRRLSADVGIPRRLSEVGVTEAYLPQMAQDAFESGNAQDVNPRKPTLQEVLDLYRQAL